MGFCSLHCLLLPLRILILDFSFRSFSFFLIVLVCLLGFPWRLIVMGTVNIREWLESVHMSGGGVHRSVVRWEPGPFVRGCPNVIPPRFCCYNLFAFSLSWAGHFFLGRFFLSLVAVWRLKAKRRECWAGIEASHRTSSPFLSTAPLVYFAASLVPVPNFSDVDVVSLKHITHPPLGWRRMGRRPPGSVGCA